MTIGTELEKIIPLIAKVSPAVSTALGFPWAGIIISALCHLFGVNSPEALTAAISTDPMAQVKIKQIEAQIAQIQATAQNQQQEITDRQNARENQLKKESDRRDWAIHFLMLITTMTFVSYVVGFKLGFISFDKEIFHNLVVMQTIVLMYYF
jgi:hypothetical protein